MSVLHLHKVIGYKETNPILGFIVVTFRGDKKFCTVQAKKWLKENKCNYNLVYSWEKK